MKRRVLCLAFALAAAGGAAQAADWPAYFAAHYVCDGGLAIRVAYPVDPLAGHPVTLRYDGQRVTMQQAPSGSGARYGNRARQLEWFIKGDEGMLIDTAADRTTRCRTGPARP
ncbi:MAG: MliC family protein [Burkholderiaceae bacterium]